MGAWGKPAANPEGSNLGADDIQIERFEPEFSVTDGAIGQAWELVKEKPFETLFLSFLSLFFGGSGYNCTNPLSSLIDILDDAPIGGPESYEQTVDAGGNFWGGFTEGLGAWVGNISMTEIGISAAIAGFVVVVMVVMWLISSLVQGGTAIFWLRHIREQDSYLGHSTKAVQFLLPIMVTQFLVGLAIGLASLLLLVPGMILTAGWIFVLHVVVDKNVGYIEAMKVSWRLTYHYKMDIFVLVILLGLLNAAGFLACCVGMIATTAISQGALAIVYNRLAEPGNAYLDVGEDVTSVFE